MSNVYRQSVTNGHWCYCAHEASRFFLLGIGVDYVRVRVALCELVIELSVINIIPLSNKFLERLSKLYM